MLFFFYGEETFQPEHKIKELTARFLEKNPSGGGLEVCDWGEDCDIVHAQQMIMAQNLFAQKKLIILKNVFAHTKAEEQKALRDTLENRAEGDVIVVWEKSTPRKNAVLFTWLTKNADTTKKYDVLEGVKLSQWIARYVQKEGGTIAKDAVQTMMLFVGSDLQKLSLEIVKVVQYAHGRSITQEDIYTLVERRVDANIFDTVEALASDDKVAALAQFKKQLLAGDDPHKILSMYAYQLRTLIAVAGEYHDQGLQDQYSIAKSAKIHPFVAQKALAVVRRIDKKRIFAAHTALVAIDADSKSGKGDLTTALEMFVMKF